jgi:two-component system, chemotaxis family, chemotaxis protein CheY
MFGKDTKILIIDDMVTMRKLVSKNLTQLGFAKITEAGDGALGWIEIEKANKAGTPFQLVISDWNMPNLTGIDLLKKVRTTSSIKNIPFILLTAESEKGQIEVAAKLNVSAYLVKPFKPQELADKLKLAFDSTQKMAA